MILTVDMATDPYGKWGVYVQDLERGGRTVLFYRCRRKADAARIVRENSLGFVARISTMDLHILR